MNYLNRISRALQHRIPKVAREVRSRLPAALRPSILMYHRIATESFDPWGTAVSPAHFAEHLEWLARNRTVLPLTRLAELHRTGALPADAVAITFDDGYRCNAEVAAPMLEQAGLPATIFLPVAWVEKQEPYWWDELEEVILGHDGPTLTVGNRVVELGKKNAGDRNWRFGIGPRTSRQRAFDEICRLLSSQPPDEVESAMDELSEQHGNAAPPEANKRPMTAPQARAIASPLIAFGSHGLRHPWLPSLTTTQKQVEIRDSRERCQAITGAARLPSLTRSAASTRNRSGWSKQRGSNAPARPTRPRSARRAGRSPCRGSRSPIARPLA